MNPTGNVTFLFTDIEGSTKLAQKYLDKMTDTLEKHNSILNNAVESNNGFVFKTIGDAFCCAFHNAHDALNAAVEAQINFNSDESDFSELKVRMGIHSGAAEWNETDYLGYITLARSARIMSAANGGQILISNTVYEQLSNNIYEIEDEISKVNIDNSSLKISFRDLGERRLKDMAQPVRLYQLLATGLKEDFPPLKTLDERPNNLPVQITSFIGREKEMKKVKDILKNSRLVTLLGTGGAGKTRLAIQISADTIDDFTNGVWLAELASLIDPALLPQTIMSVLNLKVNPEKNPEDTLFDYLKEKEILIILDNCEHLIKPCAGLIEKLLNHSAKLKILTTSREAINCSGEHLFRIPSMSFPDTNSEINSEQISQFESARLFIERALSVNQNFSINNESAPALAGICRQLDGIPLAIELAAVRTKIMTVEKIYERLNDRFNLLTGGMRTSLPRQQTLRALIDWSYDLLLEKEKLLLARLSVFSGGWSIEAAEEVCSDEKIDIFEILDLTSNLIDKSLIISKETKGNTRYYMLETIRQYSHEKLGQNLNIHRKHIEFFQKLSSKLQRDSDYKMRTEWREEMEIEQDNHRTAIRRASESSPFVNARLVINFSEYLEMSGYYKEAYEYLINIIGFDDIDYNDKADILINLAYLASYLDDNDNAEKYVEKGLEYFRSTGNKIGIAEALNIYGIISFIQGDMEDAIKHTEESLKIFEDLNEKTMQANVLGCLAAFKAGADTFEESLKLLDKAISIYSDQSQTDQLAKLLVSKGGVYYQAGDYENASKYFTEGLPVLIEVNDQNSVSSTLYNLGNLNMALKKYSEASEYFEKAMLMSKEYGFTGTFDRSHIKLGEIALINNENLKAKEIFVSSLKNFNKNSEKLKLILSIYGLGNYYFLEKNYDLSAKYFFLAGKINAELKFNLSRWREEENQKILFKLKSEINESVYNGLEKEIADLNIENAADAALQLAISS